MSGVAFTTISPSSTSSSRNTPCVDGCCGPIEIVICVSSGRSTTSNCGGMFTALMSNVQCQRLLPNVRVSRPGKTLDVGLWTLDYFNEYGSYPRKGKSLRNEYPC